MPPERNNTVRFTQLSALPLAGPNDIIPIVDTSIPTLVNKKITISGLNQSLPVGLDMANIKSVSSNWDSVYASFNSNSAEYESTFSNIISNSSNWDSVYTSVNQNSAGWTGLTTYSTVNSLSDTWSTAYALASSAYTSLSALSSGTWVLKAGDQMTGALTTTRTNTASFGLDEFVTKRYADALATASQISGNFVPGLYYTKADFQTGVVSVLSAVNLQTYGFALGTSGGSQTGTLTFNPNLYGTSVTGFTLNSTNNRSGLKVICGTYAQFNVSEQGMSWVWGGPTFQQNLLNLGDSSGNSVIAVDHYGPYHAAPLTNSVVLRSNFPFNFFIRNYSNMFLDVPTVSGKSFIADQYAVQNDGRIYNAFASPAGHNIQFASNNFFFTGNNVRTLSIAENIAPGNGGIWMRSDRIVGWSSSGDPGNSGDLRLKRIGASSLALDSGGTANTPSFTVYGNISGSGSVQTLSSFIVEQNSNTNEITPELTGMWLVRNTARHGIASTYQGTAISMLGFYYNNVGIGGIQENGGFIVPSGAGFGWSNSSAGSLTYPYARIGFFREGDFNIGLRPFNDAPSRSGFSDASLKIYKMFTDTSNYERLALSGNRIAYEFAGTGVSRDLTIVSTGNLVLSAGGSLQFSQSLPLIFSSLSASNLSIAPNFINNNTLLNIGRSDNPNVYGLIRTDGSGQGATLNFSDGGSNTFEIGGSNAATSLNQNNESPVFFHTGAARNLAGSVVRMGGFLQVGTAQPSTSARMYVAPYNTNTPALVISAFNTQVSNIFEIKRNNENIVTVNNNQLTVIGDISATGNLYTTGISYSALSAQVLTVGPANAGTGTSGSLRIANDTSGFLYPGIYSTGNGISLATYGNGGLSNIAHARTYGLLAGRSVFSGVGNPGTVAVGSGNFDETIPNIALKIGGNIGFTDGSLDGSSFVRPISATMGYDWSSNLISLSSRTSKVGFRFEPVEAGNNRPEIYSDGNLYITNNFGGGRRIYFNGSQNQLWNPFELGYNGAFAYGTIEITATQQPGTYTFPYFKITQDVKQLSNFIQAVSSNGSTILSYTSAGVLNLNSRIFLKPDGLIQFTNTSSTTPAIKGTASTVQARTGDDSQYTYLQGKLQTDQAASAGTFTPDKYLILYDSTGTAYKVPVQAL